MAGSPILLYRNYDATDTTKNTQYKESDPFPTVETLGWAAPNGTQFKEWNSARDGSGMAYQPGDSMPGTGYAIWVELHDVTITYNGSMIAAMDASGTKTCLTANSFCEGNIVVSYTAPVIPSASGVSF